MKKHEKTGRKIVQFWDPLLEPSGEGLGPLLGGSWASLGRLLASLGRPWASKMGSKRARDIDIRVFVIPSCFFLRLFSLRSASGSPLGRVLAPSWRHLGPSWRDFSRFWIDFWRFLVQIGVYSGWTSGSTKKAPKMSTTQMRNIEK